ncbi:dehypoxanthine futalosine cyclase [Campylobacter canadensis]|uniref:Cyclic dehypoxanthine futalosine synthase n=1 Tax=Campylobacter canadensis TaxID=449520 RepID=A0ABS7WT47_9BACT|nr:dehypoxanthine futalosine cyclase [Campylobacter canadensis]MBZ7987546.1 dehypoxanthine futalosine cyclase [Campylobacter canadensis]MBZ7994891.1 dehypoxanthine futalosine cyclase [Campylobacter canadensis]MBZ7996722.1 dehypoxanthine futalosine cyclase [Campylobacter canadensis]MBZ7998698.1 dehypoxanthine futalosine cyclase [Campylobacter canadensis]MBZ8000308.1 dehypoxanthine futalosine cyclase [Campylobacter canadensis]
MNAALISKKINTNYIKDAFSVHKDWQNPYAPKGLLKRISKEQALDLLKNESLAKLGELAFEAKLKLHPEKITSFVVDRNINYTNVCLVDCKFCAFYRHAKDSDSYVLSFEEIGKKIEELIAIGGTQILFQGGVHPKLDITWYEELLSYISTNYPSITIHGFSAVEIYYIAKISKISTQEVLQRMSAKGLYSIPGAGAEILSDRVRDIVAPSKCDSKTWIDIHRQAHNLGLLSSATMMFGHIESDEEIIEHLDLLRKLQDETGGFRAFILWSFQGKNTKLKEQRPDILHASSNRYLRLLAIARLYLDNFANIQSSWVTQGSYVGQLALKFGANDLGSTMMEENVVAAAGAKFRMNEEQMIHLIKDIGEKAVKRDTAYNILEEFYE